MHGDKILWNFTLFLCFGNWTAGSIKMTEVQHAAHGPHFLTAGLNDV
jgi:hypothetical protein